MKFFKNDKIRSFFSILKILYPIPILVLILFPAVVGSFINYSSLDVRQIGILLVWIPLFTIPFLLTQKTFFYYIALIICFINGFVVLGSWVLVQHPVTSSAMFVLFNTNIEEASGFAHIKSSYKYFFVILYLIYFIVSFFYHPKIKNSLKKLSYFIAAISCIIFIAFVSENSINQRLIRKGMPSLVQATIAYKKELKVYRTLKNNKDLQFQDISASAPSLKKPQVTILILGESTNRNHLSLYGYWRKTNPLLSKFKNLILYNNVISGYTHTLESVPASLSSADLDNKETPAASVTLADVMNTARYKTYWLSNQSPIGVWDNFVTLFAQQYNEKVFVNGSGNSSQDVIASRSYDQKLFHPLKNALVEKVKRKFIVVHLIGTHGQYHLRYPPNFNHFKDSSSEKNVIISAYDNAILYNDFVVDSLLKIFRSYCKQKDIIGSALYVSDHSENVYDEVDKPFGHNHGDTIPKTMVEIPFMLWLSPEYKKMYPQKSKLVFEHRNLPFVTDDLFHALIDLSSVKTPIFTPQRSVFNKNFNSDRKRVLVDGYDYDKK